MKWTGPEGGLRGCAALLAGALGMGGATSSALAQVRPITGISAHYDASGSTNGNYAVRLSTDSWSKTEQLQVVR